MSRVWLQAVVFVLVLVVVGSAGARTGRTAALRLTSAQPLVVQGLNFKAREKVRLTLESGGTVLYRTARATRRGSLDGNFGTITFGRCGGFTIRAVGSRGSSALLRKLPLPACMPERSP